MDIKQTISDEYMAMEMGNIELMVKLQVFTYIHDQRNVWLTDSSHQSHNRLIRLEIWSASLGYINRAWPEVDLALDLSLDLSTDHRACSRYTS